MRRVKSNGKEHRSQDDPADVPRAQRFIGGDKKRHIIDENLRSYRKPRQKINDNADARQAAAQKMIGDEEQIDRAGADETSQEYPQRPFQL